MWFYTDAFGNTCSRVLAPAGRFRLCNDAIIEDSGQLDEVDRTAAQYPVERLPPDVLQFLMASRYCEVDLLKDAAWQLFSQVPPGWSRAGDLRLVPFPCDVRLPVRRCNEVSSRRVPGAAGRLSRLYPSGDYILPLPEHSCPLCHRVSGRHRSPRRSGSHGLQRLVRGLPGRPLVDDGRAAQHTAIGPRPHGTWSGRRRCRAHDGIRRRQPGKLSSLDR